MSASIAVFYHCILSSSAHREINSDYAIHLIMDQMKALKDSGLADAASAIYVCVNGPQSDADALSVMVPDKAIIICHGKGATTEIPTMNVIRDWIQNHKGWYVLYHHTKGVSTPNQADNWRRRMELHNVHEWRRCVAALDSGADICGCHWLTPEQNRGTISIPFFGGTFWWANSYYLLKLPPLPPATWENRYKAESWIGMAQQRANVVDFSPGWPTP